MEIIKYIVPCHFGLEAVLKREIQDLGFQIVSVDDGRVVFSGDKKAGAAANLYLRTAERVLIMAGEFKAASYDELFEGTKKIPWEDFLPSDARFWVAKAASIKSELYSPSDIQRIMKKAMAVRLGDHYKISWLPETGASYPIRVTIKKDIVSVGIDMSGPSLHKRGYRVSPVIAPISETLAAALLMLTPWRRGRVLLDPFCGSGTFLIEAAMIAAGIAPGSKRSFLAENWDGFIPRQAFREVRREAEEKVIADPDLAGTLQGFDIDPGAIRHSRDNARAAGVEPYIHFQEKDVRALSNSKKYGFLLTNPPYGERLEDRGQIRELYEALGASFKKLDSWSMYVVSAYPDAEKAIGRKADRNRKIYNGMLKTYFYEYPGPKPPGKQKKPLKE
ncbi:MAG: class I SAM-dependent RNA methyltransferase [Lachnospiraceae bacterium]|nr:class I SAM-dependent RNA methyltransferase [Lachnospiraceae bacterium]